MFYETFVRLRDTEPMARKQYRFTEEDIDPKVVPESLGDVATLSLLFDALITEVRHNLLAENMDPLIIPDGVHKELNALIMSATLDINRIAVHNLTNIARKSAFTAKYENRVLTISIPISFLDVKVFTDYKINAGPVVISEGRIMGRVGDISLYVTFAVDFAKKKLVFEDFGIPNCDKVAVVFKGEGLSKYLLNVLTPIVILTFKSILLAVVKRMVSQQISDGMEIVNRVIHELEEERKRNAAKNPQAQESLHLTDT